MSKHLLTGLLILSLVATACGDDGGDDNPADNNTANNTQNVEPFAEDCTAFVTPTEDAEQNRVALVEQLNSLSSDDILCIGDGVYPINGQLALNDPSLSNIEIRGESQDNTVLDFDPQRGEDGSGENGILVEGVDDFRAANFTIKNTAGDAIKVQKADGVEFVNLTVTWDGGPKESNGAYGVYPVLMTNVLIEGCVISNASDAGIYVGQTKNAIVRNNEAFGNVAGLELENTSFAEAHGNHLHDNTGGLLVFDLPELEVTDGSNNKIHDNIIENNNQSNFAPGGNIVANVPQGTGILILSSSSNEIHNNTITGNKSLGLIIASYLALGSESEDETYYPFSESNYIHDNTFSNNGTQPVDLASQVSQSLPVPDLAFAGFITPELEAGTKTFEDIRNCFDANTTDGSDASFINSNLGGATFENADLFTDCSEEWTDFCHYQCQGSELPAITLD